MNRLRIAYVLPTLRKRAGWRTHAQSLLNALADEVEQVLFVAEADRLEAQQLFPGRQIFVLPVTQEFFLSSQRGPLRLAASYAAIQRRRFPAVDLVHSFEAYPTGLVGHWLAHRLKAPHLLTAHGTYAILAHAYPLDRFFYQAVLRQARFVCPVSQGTARQMQRYFAASLAAERIRPVLNGNNAWQRLPREQAFQHDFFAPPTLLTVGDIKARKGQDTSLAAFARVQQELPQARYHLVGDTHPGSQFTQEINGWIRTHGMQNVEFTGLVSDAEVERAYRQASLFVMTPRQVGYHFEGFGLVYLEAGAYGLPVVATSSGGVADAVRHGETGFLADENDIAGVAEAMLRLLKDPALARKMGQANRLWSESLTWEASAQQQLAVYAAVWGAQ